MKIDEIKEIIKLGESSSLNFFKYKNDIEEIVILKDGKDKGDLAEENKNSTTNLLKEKQEEVHILVAPYVGIVHFEKRTNMYEHVCKEDVLLTVEAMKLFNEVKSPVSGTIVEIMIADGDTVEYGQKLLKIKEDDNEK